MPPTLIGLAFHGGARPKHVPHSDVYDFTRPDHALKDWRVFVQGAQVVLVSPPKNGVSTLVQVPRTRCDLFWAGTAEDVGQLDRGQWPAVKAEPKETGVGTSKEKPR